MNKQTWWRVAAVGLSVAVVAGCGAVVRDAVAREEAVAVVGGYALAGAGGELGGAPGPLMGLRPGLVLANKLGLSAEQKAQAQAIAAKYRADLRPAHLGATRQALAAIALAPEVDPARLAAFLRDRASEIEAQKPARLALASELRAVLTPAQRETLAGLLEAGGTELGARLDGLRSRVRAHATRQLRLTPAQLAKVDGLEARVEALRQDPRKDEARRALAAFVRTGDRQALSAGLPRLAEVLPVAEIVAVVASLDLAQRQQIAAQGRRFAAARLGPHPF